MDKEAASQEATELAAFQSDSGDVRLAYGFHFGRKKGSWLPHVSPVSTAFGLQTLMMWREYLEERFAAQPSDLI